MPALPPDLKDLIIRKVFAEGETPDLSRFLHLAAHRTRALTHEWAVYARERDGGAGILPLMVVQVPRVEQDELEDVLLDIHAIVSEEWLGLIGQGIAHVIGSCGASPVRMVDPEVVEDDSTIRVVVVDEVVGRWRWPRAGVLVSFRGTDDGPSVAALLERLIDLPLGSRLPGADYLNGLECYLPLMDWHVARGIARTALDGDELDERLTSTVVVDLDRHALPEEESVEEDEDDNAGFLSEPLEDEDDAEVVPPPDVDGPNDPSRVRWDHEVREVAPSRKPDTDKKKPLVYERTNERGTQGRVKPPPVVPTHPAYSSTGLAYFDDRWPARLEKERLEALHPRRPAPIPLKVVRAYRTDPRVAFDPLRTEFSLFAHGGVWEAYDALVSDVLANGEVVATQLARPHTRNAEGYVVGEDGRRYTLPTYPHHLTADDGGLFPVAMSGLETRLMMRQARKENFVAWYCNPEARRPEALSFPSPGGDTIAPTFLFFTSTPSGRVTASLMDVHDFHAPDALDRLRALARYAARHERRFAGIESMWRVEQEPVGIDLSAAVVRAAIERATSAEGVYRAKGYLLH